MVLPCVSCDAGNRPVWQQTRPSGIAWATWRQVGILVLYGRGAAVLKCVQVSVKDAKYGIMI
jgi:hypothetical protein